MFQKKTMITIVIQFKASHSLEILILDKVSFCAISQNFVAGFNKFNKFANVFFLKKKK